MIEIDPQLQLGLWAYAGLREFIVASFPRPVDVVDIEGLKPFIRP